MLLDQQQNILSVFGYQLPAVYTQIKMSYLPVFIQKQGLPDSVLKKKLLPGGGGGGGGGCVFQPS